MQISILDNVGPEEVGPERESLVTAFKERKLAITNERAMETASSKNSPVSEAVYTVDIKEDRSAGGKQAVDGDTALNNVVQSAVVAEEPMINSNESGPAAATVNRVNTATRSNKQSIKYSNSKYTESSDDNESLTTWTQIKDNRIPSSTKTRKVASNVSAAGLCTISAICGRSWSHDRVLAEILNAEINADAPDYSEGMFLFDRRPFIGKDPTDIKEVTISKAIRSSDIKLKKKLNDERKRAESTSAPLEISITFDSEPKADDSRDNSEPENSPKDFKPRKASISISGSIPQLSEDVIVNSDSPEDDQVVLLSASLQPHERRMVTIGVKPSCNYVDEKIGLRVGAQLFNRSIDMLLETCVSPDAVQKKFSHNIAFKFKACTSIINVSPKIYYMGTCNVGENRTAIFEIKNESDLPAVVFPVIQSTTLDLSERQLELRIPRNEMIQVKIGYVAKSVDPEYTDCVTFLNGYNDENQVEIELRAENVDTQKHSLYYKLITTNELQQINFDRCLVNMPNLRIFTIRNIHSADLQFVLKWKRRSNIRLFLISSAVDGDNNNVVDGESLSQKQSVVRNISFQNSELKKRDQAIEDLKWGDSDRSSQGTSLRKFNNLRLSFGDELKGISAYSSTESSSQKVTDLMRPVGDNSKSSRSADLLSILDVSQSDGNYLNPLGSNIIEALNLTLKLGSYNANMQEASAQGGASRQESARTIDAARDFVTIISNSLKIVEKFDKDNFPFNLLSEFEVDEDITATAQKTLDDKQIKLIQKSYLELNEMVLHTKEQKRVGCLKYLPSFEGIGADLDLCSSNDDGVEVLIPRGESYRFALLFEPQFVDEVYQRVEIKEQIQIYLPQINASKTISSLSLTSEDEDKSRESKVLTERIGPLKPRTITVTASLLRSEMVVAQKNLNFGRTVLGDVTSLKVTVVNRSSITCLYEISKTGSISSDYLKVPEGRRGSIPPFSFKNINFIFEPILAEPFEEVVQINNLLNPSNSQSITIKAKVLKKDAFIITANPPTIPALLDEYKTSPTSKSSVDSLNNYFERVLLSTLYPSLDNSSSMQTTGIVSAPSTNNLKSNTASAAAATAVFHLGAITVGEDSDHQQLSFKIKNATSKSRQFIVDATHINAVVLLLQSGPMINMNSDLSGTSPRQLEPEHIASAVPFDPIPDILQSVLALRCSFESVITSASSVGGEGNKLNDSALTASHRKQLEDQLEGLNQKLKIAIRKNKPDKIKKHEKKISEVILSLGNNKLVNTLPSGSVIDSLEVTTATENDLKTEVVPIEQQTVSKKKETRMGGRSEVSYHFYLEPEQEKCVKVKLSFLPGMNYRSWHGLLPFSGYLRIFESKNEDHVKTICFGAMIRSTRVLISSNIPFSETHAESHDDARRPLGSKGRSDSMDQRDEELSEIRSWAVRMQSRQSFITTVAQWCAVPTIDIYPKYRQIQQNMLALCIKLIAGSQDRVMHGAMSIASLMEQVGVINLTIDESFSAKLSSEYVTYNPKVHGLISFSLAAQSTSTATGNIDHLIITDKTPETSVLATQIGASIDASKTSLGSKKDRIIKESAETESESKLKGGSKIDVDVKWHPSPDIQQVGSLKILGAILVQLRIDDQTFGPLQSIPFIGVLEHKSNVKVSKYFTFDGVAVGSYRTCQIPINNLSETEELHYAISSEEVTSASRVLGKLDIISGQTGVISPGGSKQFNLKFSATASGKFEQRLWIRNIRESFDQRRILIQANISVSQMKFVTFPDLNYATDAFGKYKPIDFGRIQIQVPDYDSDLMSVLPHVENQSIYKLRIENTSGSEIHVTAVSNLKNQCYIYADENCRFLAYNCRIAEAETITLFVMIRPAPIKASSLPTITPRQTTVSSVGNINIDEGVGTAVTPAGSDLVDDMSKRKTVDSRELTGGIKLHFFVIEGTLNADESLSTKQDQNPSDSTADVTHGKTFTLLAPEDVSPLTMQGNMRRLFETTLPFKATVGKSILQMRSPVPNSIQYVSLSISDEPSASTTEHSGNMFFGRFQLKNASKLFKLTYCYVINNAMEECMGRVDSTEQEQRLMNDVLKRSHEQSTSDIRTYILDDLTGELEPEQSRWIRYAVRHSCKSSGLIVCPIRVVNLNTYEFCTLSISTFLNSNQLSSTSIERERTVLENDVNTPSMIAVPYASESKFIQFKSQSPIWLRRYHDDAPQTDPLHVVNSDPSSNDTMYRVRGSAILQLSNWVISNHQNKAITLSPVSDLPVTAYHEIVCDDGPYDDALDAAQISSLKSHFKSFSFKENQSKSTMFSNIFSSDSTSPSYSKKIAPGLIQWRKHLKRCGESFTVNPNSSVRIIIIANKDSVVGIAQLKDLSNTLSNATLVRKLDEGKIIQMQGVVVFLQAAQALQSLFEQPTNAPAKDTSLISDTVPVIPTNKVADVAQLTLALPKVSNLNKTNKSLDQFQFLPIVSIASLNCDIAAPLLHLPLKEKSVGRLRCGEKVLFSVNIDNVSEVEAPCAIEKLPHWLQFHSSSVLTAKATLPVESAVDSRFDTAEVNFSSIDSDGRVIIPRKSTLQLTFVATAPVIESQLLECLVTFRSLNTQSDLANNIGLDRGGIEAYHVRVYLEVDAKRALELIPSTEDEEFYPRRCRNAYDVNTVKLATNGLVCDQSNNSLDVNVSESGMSFYRVINDSFMIPPPAEVTADAKHVDHHLIPDNFGPVPIQASRKDTNKSQCRFSLKNKLSDTVQVEAVVELNPPIKELLELSALFRTNGCTSIELDAEEYSQVEVKVKPNLNSRLDIAKLKDAIYEMETADETNSKVLNNDGSSKAQTTSEPPAALNSNDRFNRPLLLGTIRFIPKQPVNSGNKDESKSSPTQSMMKRHSVITNNDIINVDIVGFMHPGPTASSSISIQLSSSSLGSSDQLTPLSTDSINRQADLLNFKAITITAPVETSSSDLPYDIRHGSNLTKFYQNPTFELIDDLLYFYVINPSPDCALNFAIKSKSYRHAGMRLILPTKDLSGSISRYDYYDSIYPKVHPSRSIIPPQSAIRVSLCLLPGDVSTAQKSSITLTSDIPDAGMRSRRLMAHHDGSINAVNPSASTTGLSTLNSNQPSGPFTVMCMSLELWDQDHPYHPPKLIYVYLTSDMPIPVLVTQQVSETNRNKHIEDRSLVDGTKTASDLDNAASFDEEDFIREHTDSNLADSNHLEPLKSSLRLRGITPHATIPGRYFIDLGQQIQRREAIEWMLTIENRSDNRAITYRIMPLFNEDYSWLTLGQTGGVIEAAGSRSIMIYIRRNNLGSFMTYIGIENCSATSDVHYIAVLIDVVIDPKKMTTISSVNNNSTGRLNNLSGTIEGTTSVNTTSTGTQQLTIGSSSNVDLTSIDTDRNSIDTTSMMPQSSVKISSTTVRKSSRLKSLFQMEEVDSDTDSDSGFIPWKTYSDSAYILEFHKQNDDKKYVRITNLSDVMLHLSLELTNLFNDPFGLCLSSSNPLINCVRNTFLTIDIEARKFELITIEFTSFKLQQNISTTVPSTMLREIYDDLTALDKDIGDLDAEASSIKVQCSQFEDQSKTIWLKLCS